MPVKRKAQTTGLIAHMQMPDGTRRLSPLIRTSDNEAFLEAVKKYMEPQKILSFRPIRTHPAKLLELSLDLQTFAKHYGGIYADQENEDKQKGGSRTKKSAPRRRRRKRRQANSGD